MIISILAAQQPHSDLEHITAIDGVAPVRMPITPADYLVLCQDRTTLAIGYRGPAEILHDIRRDSLMPFLINLKQRSPWAYLLIGGAMTPQADNKIRLGDTVTGWSWPAYQGALLSAQELGVGVVTLRHAQDVPATIATLARRSRGSIKARPTRDGLFYSPTELLLLALPGIGEARMEALLEHCGDAATALLALTWDGADIPGIGPDTRRKVRETLGLNDGETIGRLTIDAAPPQILRKAA